MALTETIANGAISIALQGWEAAKAQLIAIEAQVKKTGNALLEIGGTSAKGFASLTATLTGLLRVADPFRFSLFTAQLEILSIQVGRIFIPLLQDAISWLGRMADYFRGLSDEQRENILYWGKIVLGITAAGTAIAVLGSAITALIGTLRALAVAIAVVEAETGVGLLLVLAGAVTAVAGLIYQSGILDGVLAKLGANFRGLGAFGDKVSESWNRLVGVAQKLWDRIVTVFYAIAESASGLWDVIGPQLGELGESLLNLLASVADLAVSVGGVLLTMLGGSLSTLLQLGTLLARVFGDVLVSALTTVVDILAWVVDQVAALLELLQDALDWGQQILGIGGIAKREKGAGDWEGGASSSGSSGKGKGGNSDRFAPMIAPKVQIMGVEEAYRKAQEGAKFDPQRLAQQEMIRIANRTANASERTANNTEKRPMAEQFGGGNF